MDSTESEVFCRSVTSSEAKCSSESSRTTPTQAYYIQRLNLVASCSSKDQQDARDSENTAFTKTQLRNGLRDVSSAKNIELTVSANLRLIPDSTHACSGSFVPRDIRRNTVIKCYILH